MDCAGCCMEHRRYAVPEYQNFNRFRIYLRDISSLFLISESMTADKIAVHLERLFKQYGAPLFLKRDNAGNLNHGCVNEVLTKYWVIPFNSPTYYPPYNGGIEKSQGEVKQWLRRHCSSLKQQKIMLENLTQNALHELNHMPRRVLSWAKCM